MKKVDVAQILLRGTPRQRAEVYFNHLAYEATRTGKYLTGSEELRLHDSFRTNLERRIYRQVEHAQRGLFSGMAMLKQYHLFYRETAQRLCSLCFSYIQAQHHSETLNELYYQIKGETTRKEIVRIGIERSLLFFPIEFDSAKKLFKVTVRHPDSIDACTQNTADALSKTIASLEAMYEAMERWEYHPTPLVEHLRLVEDDLKEDKAPLPHYSADRDEFMQKLNPIFTFPTWKSVERDEGHKRLMLKEVIDF